MSKSILESVQYLKSVGPKRAKLFSEIGINTIYDLLFYFPKRYIDRSTILDSKKVREYISKGYTGEITIIGKVIDTSSISYGRKRIFKVTLSDPTGKFELVWFQGIKYFKDVFQIDQFYAVSSKPVISKYNHLQFMHPDFDRIVDEENYNFLNTGKIIPFYTIPQKIKNKSIGELGIRKIIGAAVEIYSDSIADTIPNFILKKYDLMELLETIKTMHLPSSYEMLKKAQKRLKFEELFFIQILVALRRKKIFSKKKDKPFTTNADLIKKFLHCLPYELTKDQKKVLKEIRSDLESRVPMNRLLQGDVGSGKTLVALIAMLITIGNGYQAALMVPTEILASQHCRTFKNFLKDFDIEVIDVTGSNSSRERKSALQKLKSEAKLIVIGTHALFEEKIEFMNLGLVVIDEQHRFGVAQRGRLIDKGITQNVLVMTATPIPRTLAMTVYGELDVSIIENKPGGILPIKTVYRKDNKLDSIYKFIGEEIDKGRQCYIVYPLIEESEKIDLKAAEIYYEKLKNYFSKNITVGLLHGKMNADEKDSVMSEFAEGKINVLISTTVIEVGIDVPNASIILINDADRFGLAQLHQLRGRVGRGEAHSYCILMSKYELGKSIDFSSEDFEYLSNAEIERNKASIRLAAMVKFGSGFDLSEIDLKLRGPGNIFGSQQSGLPELIFADIIHDYDLLVLARAEAQAIIESDPQLKKEENFSIKKNLIACYSENIKLSNIA
ncbi:MAG: ATP-dependent DNA helicase RecG [Bacteroidetes bacterium]|nr:ATP-dependent DNA helicase RecG [Bacteroidota bacterium]MBU2505739.1 ATP-dependent DNA helicase RecG [Bacteroidota bacterium]